MNFRLASINDAKELTRLRWQLITEDSGVSVDVNFDTLCTAWFKDIIASSRWFVVVAVSSTSSLSGCMCLQRVDAAPNANGLSEGWGYLTNCYVEKMQRNKNIGDALLRNVILLGKQSGLELILVWPSERSVDFYRRVGFQSVELAHSQDGDEAPLEYRFD